MVRFFLVDYVKFHKRMNHQCKVRHLTPSKKSPGNYDVLRDNVKGCNTERGLGRFCHGVHLS